MNPACPPAWWIYKENKQRDISLTTVGYFKYTRSIKWDSSLLIIYFHHSPFCILVIDTPSLTRSNTSLTSKLISSVSWPMYWYIARQRGPWGRGCGLGAGGGRWLMLLFLCFLWQRQKMTKGIKGAADERDSLRLNGQSGRVKPQRASLSFIFMVSFLNCKTKPERVVLKKTLSKSHEHL